MVSVGVIARPNCYLASASCRCPVASLCSAPLELGFPLLSRFEPCSFVFQAGRCPEIDNVITAALCRPIETSSEVDDNKRARHRQPCRQRNGTRPKFFNDFSRARARRHASARARRCPFGSAGPLEGRHSVERPRCPLRVRSGHDALK